MRWCKRTRVSFIQKAQHLIPLKFHLITFRSSHSEGSEMYEAALELKEDCHEYADAIKTCTDCYESRLSYEIQPNFFESVCTKPHLLVLAKCDGFPLWPAKLMRYNNDNRIATIQCFGDHQEADVPFDKCFLYSNAFRRTKDKKHITNLEKGYKVRTVDLFAAAIILLQTLQSCISGSRKAHRKHRAQVRVIRSSPNQNSHKRCGTTFDRYVPECLRRERNGNRR